MYLIWYISGLPDEQRARAQETPGIILQDFGRRIGRVIFYPADQEMILLHGFIKKSQKTPQSDIDLAEKRKKEYLRNGKKA